LVTIGAYCSLFEPPQKWRPSKGAHPPKAAHLPKSCAPWKASLCFKAANRDNEDDFTVALLSGKIEDGVALSWGLRIDRMRLTGARAPPPRRIRDLE
jgi:hypothetical protein